MPIPINPMLAQKSKDGIPTDGYKFEIKWDGMRVIVERTEESVRLWTRRGLEVTDRFPELLNPLCFKQSGIFDGEIVCFDQFGKSNFRTVVGRRHNKHKADIGRRSIQAPANCMIFDCLKIANETITDQAWSARRQVLEKGVIVKGPINPYKISKVYEDGDKLFEYVKEQGLEGIMAKDIACHYEPGKRTRHWLKIKLLYTEDVLVTGFTTGKGKREGYFGSLIITDMDGNDLGNVGTGFTDQELIEYMAMFREIGAQGAGDQFQLLRPIPAEVRHMENTIHGKLREPVFMRFRTED